MYINRMNSPEYVAVGQAVAIRTVAAHSIGWVLVSVATIVSHLKVSSKLHSGGYQSEAWV